MGCSSAIGGEFATNQSCVDAAQEFWRPCRAIKHTDTIAKTIQLASSKSNAALLFPSRK
jgi:hypothetical protein